MLHLTHSAALGWLVVGRRHKMAKKAIFTSSINIYIKDMKSSVFTILQLQL